jgi:sulfur-carrier protein
MRKSDAASVVFYIPEPLRPFAGGRSRVGIESSASTLYAALQELWVACPAMRDRVVTEQGQIREHVNLFVGNEDVRYTGGLATPIPRGTEISIVPAISGGVPAKNHGASSEAITARGAEYTLRST